MSTRPLRALAPTLAVASFLGGCAAHPAADARVAERPRHVYRFDFVVTTTDPAKAPVATSYTLNLEEDRGGEVKVGANVPLGSTNVRQDVGLMLRCHYDVLGDDLLLHTNTEISSFDAPPTVRKMIAGGDAVVTPGAPVLIASAEEPVTHARTEVKVTATRVR